MMGQPFPRRRSLSFLITCIFILVATEICRSQQPLTDEAREGLAEAARLNQKVIELHAARNYDEAIPLAKRELVLKLRNQRCRLSRIELMD
jgi:hypothetical protein